MSQPDRALARRLAHESLERGDVTGWFDKLYDAAAGNEQAIPWADMCANPHLVDWLDAHPTTGAGKRALVVGCGLGDDAEELARRGFHVTGFDVSGKAVEWCQRRFPGTVVTYRVADLLDLPPEWHGQFDLVVEIYTLQVLPPESRRSAMEQMAHCVAPAGTLLLVARGRDADDQRGSMPWPLTRAELKHLSGCGLEAVAFEDFLDRSEEPPVRRFCVEYHKSG